MILRDPILDPILTNPTESNQQWEDACKQVLASDFQTWKPIWAVDWETGNPIYSLCDLSRNKAVRIIQNERMTRHGMYMKKVPRPDTFEDLIDEVVFCCSLTESTLSVFKLIFRVWTRPQTDAAYMNDLLTRCSLWDLDS